MRAPNAAATAAVLALLGLESLLLARALDFRSIYDEGVYVASVQALRHGQELGTEVFTPQPPGFYALLELLSHVFGATLRGLREATLATVVAGTGAAYLAGRPLAGVTAGIAAAALLVIAPPLPLLAGRVFADTPAMMVAVAALALAAYRRPTAAGAVLVAAVAVKLSAVTAVGAVLAVCWTRCDGVRGAARATAGAAGAVAILALAYHDALRPIWDDAVGYHQKAQRIVNLSASHELRGFFTPTTPFFWFLVAGAVALAVDRRTWPLWLWPPLAVAFVIQHEPLHVNHLVVLPVSFAVAAGVSLGAVAARLDRRALAAAGVAAATAWAAGYVQQVHRLDGEQTGEDPALLAAARTLERVTTEDDEVVTDQPIVAVLARRTVPGPLVDTAQLRFDTGSLTAAEVVAAIESRRVGAVVVGRSFGRQPAVVAAAERRFPAVTNTGGVAVYHRRRR